MLQGIKEAAFMEFPCFWLGRVNALTLLGIFLKSRESYFESRVILFFNPFPSSYISHQSFSVTLTTTKPSKKKKKKKKKNILMDYNNHNLPTSNPPPRPSHGTRREGSRNSSIVPRLTLMLLMFFITLCLIIFIAWLVIHPLDPAIQLNSLSLSNITVSNSQFAADYDIEFTVNNTNKKVNLWIDDVKVLVSYGKDGLSSKVFEENVYLGKMGGARFKAELERDAVCSLKHTVFKDLSDEWSQKMVNFNVKLFIRAGFEVGILPTKQRIMEVWCMNLPVEFLSTKGTGKLMGRGKGCLVHA